MRNKSIRTVCIFVCLFTLIGIAALSVNAALMSEDERVAHIQSQIDSLDIEDKRKIQLMDMATQLESGTWKISGRDIIDIPITNIKAFPEYYDLDLYAKYNIESNEFSLFTVKNTITGNDLIYVTNPKTEMLSGISADFTHFEGYERCFFDDDNHLVLLTQSARGYKELQILDIESNTHLFDDSGMTITAMYYDGNNVYVSDGVSIYNEDRDLIYTVSLNNTECITSFAISDNYDTIVCFTSEYNLITFKKDYRDGEYKEVYRSTNNSTYTEYKEIVLTGDYFYLRKTDEYKKNCAYGYVEGGTLHCYTDLVDNILYEATSFGTISINVLTGEVDLSGLSPQITPMPESYINYNA